MPWGAVDILGFAQCVCVCACVCACVCVCMWVGVEINSVLKCLRKENLDVILWSIHVVKSMQYLHLQGHPTYGDIPPTGTSLLSSSEGLPFLSR